MTTVITCFDILHNTSIYDRKIKLIVHFMNELEITSIGFIENYNNIVVYFSSIEQD